MDGRDQHNAAEQTARLRAARAALRASYGAMSDRELVLAMRRDARGAIEEFMRRFHRLLLSYARRAGLSTADGDALVYEILEDAAIELSSPGAEMPEHVAASLVRRFRNRLLKLRRSTERYERHVREAAIDVEYAAESDEPQAVVGCSQFGLRQAWGAEPSESRYAAIIDQLSVLLDEGLSEEERQLLAAVSERVSQRRIAEALGMSHGALRVKLSRLRKKLCETAVRYGDSLDADRAAALRAFLRRCGVSVRSGTDD